MPKGTFLPAEDEDKQSIQKLSTASRYRICTLFLKEGKMVEVWLPRRPTLLIFLIFYSNSIVWVLTPGFDIEQDRRLLKFRLRGSKNSTNSCCLRCV